MEHGVSTRKFLPALVVVWLFGYASSATQSALPGAPEQLVASVTGGQVTLSWQAPSVGAPVLEYVLEAGNAPGSSNLGSFSMGPSTGVVATPSPGVYYVRVRARNALGFGPFTDERSFTVGFTGPPPAVPPPAFSAIITPVGVLLAWARANNQIPDVWQLLVGSTAGQADTPVLSFPGTHTSIVVPNVPAGTYYLRLRALLGGVANTPSAEVMIVVP